MNRSSDFVVSVPATTANLGSSFDSIGMALDLWNTLDVSASTENVITIDGEGSEILPKDSSNLVYKSLVAGCDKAGIKTPVLSIHSHNNIPLTRGLGSSAAAVVAGLLIANNYANHALNFDDLLDLASQIEGHPDNVAPALLGGVRLVIKTEDRYIERGISMKDGLRCLIYIPNEMLATSESRSVLPQEVPFENAVFNLSRTALTIRSLVTGEWQDLIISTQDNLHQDYRSQLSPNMRLMINLMNSNGANGSFISGAGPSVIGFAPSDQVLDLKNRVENQMQKEKIDGRLIMVAPSLKGAHIIGENSDS